MSSDGGDVRRWRRAVGLTQEELAERSGLSVRTIRELERGRTERPYRRTVESVAAALDLNEVDTTRLLSATRGLPPDRDVPAGRPVPAQLPWAVGHFTGRATVQRHLDDLLVAGSCPGQLVVSVLTGMPGVGKTALAMHWAHHVADRFSDGQLYANLSGYAASPPVEPAQVLRGFLRALGVESDAVSRPPDELAACYRSALVGRRVLVLLDNVRSAAQVRPLLSNSPTCVVLVTSRNNLSGLAVRDGARHIEVECLPEGDSVLLLSRIVGAQRVAAEPLAAARLARLCGYLPLALRAVAERAAQHPDLPLSELAATLADQTSRLDTVDTPGDPASALRTLLSWSYRALPEHTARLFRLLSLHSGRDFSALAAAHLAGTSSVDRVDAKLQSLVDAHLLESPAPGRYHYHDLVRLYAAERAVAEESRQERRDAVYRMVDWYQRAAVAAAEVSNRPWLAVEQGNLVAAVREAARLGEREIAGKLDKTVRYIAAEEAVSVDGVQPR